MAGLGFKDFAVGEVLTAADVDGYLMQQTVMRFADAGARGSALGTATGTAVPLAEGMVSYLDDVNRVEVYNGTGWVSTGGFSASTAITATDASWPVPTLADPVVKVTVVAGGGSGGSRSNNFVTNNGNDSSFASAAGTVTATAGTGGITNGGALTAGMAALDGWRSWNGGQGGVDNTADVKKSYTGQGGQIVVGYVNLSGISTVAVTVGAGGATAAAAGGDGGAGGDGVVIVEYRAG